MVWIGTTLPSLSSRGKYSFGGRGSRALTKWLNAGICMEGLKGSECKVEFELNTEK
jgi:hypothetical protein